MNTTPDVAVCGVSKTYSLQVLADITFNITGPRICGLVGRNGAGKTSLLQLISGRDYPDSGEITVYGERPHENGAIQERICFVREGQYYPDDFTAGQALTWAGRFQPNWDSALANQLLGEFQVPAERKVRKLSRGMTSALTAIIGIAARAPLTIFDEPYLGMDPVARQLFYQHLLASYAEHPRTIVLSTHLVDEVSGILEHILLLERGQLLLDEDADTLRAQSVSVSGPAAAVDSFTAGRQVIHREAYGHLARTALRARLSDSDRAAASRTGLEIAPLTLQQLTVASAMPAQEAA